MPVIETFSRRQKRLAGSAEDVFHFDLISKKIRVQAAIIIANAYGVSEHWGTPNPLWNKLHDLLAEEFGHLELSGFGALGAEQATKDFLIEQASTEEFLDAVEISVALGIVMEQEHGSYRQEWQISLDNAEMRQELNDRFRIGGLGYRFPAEETKIIRVDNEHLHKEVIAPVLRLLRDPNFEGANAEYREAHRHYMQGDYKATLNECLKAFESTMKSICKLQDWEHKPGDTAARLIDICIENKLFPPYFQQHLGSIKALLTSAIPTLRNKHSGHGQGATVQDVPPYFAEYLLYETATSIIFLVEALHGLDG